MSSRLFNFVRALCLCACLFACLSPRARAQCPSSASTISGRLLQSRYFGAQNVIQDTGTGFGNQAPPSMADSTGNELDRLFVTNNGATLYVAMPGNTIRSDVIANTVILFVDTGNNGGTAVLNTAGFTGGSSALRNMSGVTLDFAPEFAFCAWNVMGTPVAVRHNLTNPSDAGVALSLGSDYAVNNSNLRGVTDNSGDDPLLQSENALSAVNGFEFAIPLSVLSVVTGNQIQVQALIANGTGFIGNQSLPPLNPTVGVTGGGVGCLGVHDAMNNPIDLSGGSFPANQYVSYTISASFTTPRLPINGTSLPTAYPSYTQRSVQNNYTCMDDAKAFNPGISDGNELDLLYIRNDFGKLYLGLAGNVALSDNFENVMLIFIETPGSFSTNVMATSGFPNLLGPGVIQPMDGFTFDSGFAPNWVIQIWRQNGATRAIRQNLDNDGTETDLTFTVDSSNHTNLALNAIAADLTNIDGVNDVRGDDPVTQTTLARTAKKGVQLSLNLAQLGIASTAGSPQIKVCAMIASVSNGGVDAFLSNQFLPPLNPTPGMGTPLTSSDSFAPNLAIPDNANTTYTTILTNASPLARVTGITVTVNLTHPAVQQLRLDLRHDESGRTVRLFNGEGTGPNMVNTTFSILGTNFSTWVSPGTGTWKGTESLLTFQDVDPHPSTWSLVMYDTVAGQTGTLNSFTINLRYDIGGAVDCVGNHNPDPLEGEVNIVDLNNYAGTQYHTYTLVNASGPRPLSFTGDNITGAFGDTSVASPLQVQNNYTCFGNATGSASAPASAGSEMDQMFLRNTENRIRIAIPGNLETNGNAFVLLMDTVPGGDVMLTHNPTPPRPLGGDGSPTSLGLNGLILDAGFNPDYALVANSDSGRFRVDLTNLTTNTNRPVGRGSINTGSGFLDLPLVGGSEVNQLFIQNDATNLYMGFTGNIEGNNNGMVVFLDTRSGGQNTLSTAGGSGWPSHLTGMHNDILPSGFNADFAVVFSRSGSFYNDAKLVELGMLANPPTNIPFTANFTIAPNTFVGDNNNVVGVNSTAADDPATQAVNAATAKSGLIVALQRSAIGSPTNGTPIRAFAIVVGSSGFWSNQAIPGLGGGVANLGNGPVNASTYASVGYTVSPTYAAPSPYNGVDIPAAMPVAAAATQNNYTQFGNQILEAPLTMPSQANPNGIQVAWDNSNTGGVAGCAGCPATCVANVVTAGSVDTGLEFDIALADVGLTGPVTPMNMPTIRVLAILTGSTGFMSNQLLPGIGGGRCNLGNQPVDLGDNAVAPGVQYMTYTLQVPTCSSIAGDINGDSVRNAADITAFVGVLLGTNNNACDVSKSEFYCDDQPNGLDTQGFVQAYLAP